MHFVCESRLDFIVSSFVSLLTLFFYKQDYIGNHTERFKHHDKLKEPVNAASVGKWRTQMTVVDRAVFAEEAGTLMDL